MFWQRSTTWAFVRMSPWALTTTPEPLEISAASPSVTLMQLTMASATAQTGLMNEWNCPLSFYLGSQRAFNAKIMTGLGRSCILSSS